MSYGLGIDLGTTFASAAVTRDRGVEVVTLGERDAAVPSIVHFGHDGAIATGEAAQRRAKDDLSRTAREFKRRLGDDTPILLGETSFPPQLLIAHQLRNIYDLVVERQGREPNAVVVTHPASWGPFKVELLQEALELAKLHRATLVTEAAAAAADHFSHDDAETVAVYDLGGSTFNAAVVRRTDGQPAIVGAAGSVERLGGNDFDQAIFDHVRSVLDGALDDADRQDPGLRSALLRLRQECVKAKEALSTDSEVTIPVALPGVETTVRLTRVEFEDMVRPIVIRSVASLEQTMADAEIDRSAVSSVVLAGGCSTIPLVGELLATEFERPVAIDPHPRFMVVRGAARLAAAKPSKAQPVVGAASTLEPPPAADERVGTSVASDGDATAIANLAKLAVPSGATATSAPSWLRPRSMFGAAVVAAVLLTGGGAAAAFGAGPFSDKTSGGPTEVTTPTVNLVAEVEPTTTTSRATTTSQSTTTAPSTTQGPPTTAAPATTHRTTTTAHHATTVATHTTHHPHHTTTTTTATETTFDTTTTTDPETTTTSTTEHPTSTAPKPTTKEFPIPHTLTSTTRPFGSPTDL